MAHKKIDPESLEYIAYETARKEYRAAAQYLYRLRLQLPKEHLRNTTESTAWAVFIQKYRQISRRFFDAKQALTSSLSAPSSEKSEDLKYLAAILTKDAPLVTEISVNSLPERNVEAFREELLKSNPAFKEIARAAALSPEDQQRMIEEADNKSGAGLGVSFDSINSEAEEAQDGDE
jgi:hypothetical protein